MRPWREQEPNGQASGLQREAAELLKQGASLPPWPAPRRLAVLQHLRVDAAEEPSRAWREVGWRLPLTLCGAVALVALAAAHQRVPTAPRAGITQARPPALPADADDWAEVDLGGAGSLRVARGSIYRVSQAPGDERVALDQGKLCAEIAHRDLTRQRPFLVEMPDSQAVVIGTRFCVEVRDGVSTLSVSEGRVQMRTPIGSAFVDAGESVSSHDPRLLPRTAAMAPSAPPRAGAPARPGVPVRPIRAIARAVTPTGAVPSPPAPSISPLAEQNALYARAIAARDGHDGPAALAEWRAYLQRFPQGALAPEASTGVLSELVAEGRTAEALGATTDYLARFPADGRAAEVAFVRGDLLREKETARALSAYRQAYELGDRPRLRDEALFAIAACQGRLGRSAEAAQTLRRYRSEFPAGAHAAEVSTWLGR